MIGHDDQKIFRTFEEFEREELRRLDAIGSSVGDYLGDLFAVDLDVRGLPGDEEDDDERT